MEQEIRFCTSADGTGIAYATYGEPTAQALVAVQNFQDPQEVWWKQPLTRALYEGLASRRRLVTFDRRGVGGSQRDVDDLEIPTQVADLAAVVDRLGLESFDLVCWGDGGPLAAAYAVEHPERVGRFVLWTPMMRTWDPVPQGFLDLAQSFRANWSLGRRSWSSFMFPNGPTEMQRWFSNTVRDSMTAEVAARHMEAGIEFDSSANLRNVQAPSLVLANSDSEIVSIRAVASLIQDARLVTLEGATFTLGVFKSFLAALQSFLDEADAESEAAALPVPGGFATILFTDMEGSTTLTEKLGDAAAQEVRHAHNDIVRSALSDNGGSEIKHTGDGIMASFATASSGLDAAIAIQRGVAAHKQEHPDSPLGVYVGLNAGEPIAEDDPGGRVDLFGTSVNLAARICDHAQPGQIVAADVVRQLAAGKQFLFADLGETELRGFEDPVKLWEVRWREQG